MKKILLLFMVGSFVFAGVSFNKGVQYSELDSDAGVTVNGTMGIDFDLNDSMSLGWDTARGMTINADVPMGLTLRLGYMGATSSIGLGYNWWSGGDAIKTTIGTSIDYMTPGGGDDATAVSLNVGWGW